MKMLIIVARLSAIVLLIVSSITSVYGLVFTSAQSGYFSIGSTWVGGAAPAEYDDIIISSGHTVTLDVAPIVYNITIQNGATLDNATYSLTIGNSSVGNPIYNNNGIHNGTGYLIAYDDYKTELSGNGISNCTIIIRSYGLSLLNDCQLTINGNIQHASPGNIGMNGKILIEAWQIGATLTVNGNIVTNPVYGGVGIENGANIIVNGNVSLPGSSDTGSGAGITNFAGGTFNISGDLSLGPFSSYCQNYGSMVIGGDLTGGYDTYFFQEVNAVVKFGGSVFPDGNGFLFAVNSPVTGSSEPNTIEYNGTTAQSIAPPADGAYSNLVVNNPGSGGVALSTDISLNGNLVLSNGLLTLGDYNLILSGNTNIEGTPSPANMIVATGAGELRKVFEAPGSFTFPVGDNEGTAEYSPVTLDFTAGTFTGAFAGVNLANNAFPGVTGSHLNRYWNISSSGITDFACDAQFDYVPADVIGNESNLFCYRIAPTVDQYNATNTVLHQLSASGLTSFGTFTGNQQPDTERTLILSQVFLQGLYESGGMMRQALGETGPQFGEGIADEVTVELHSSVNYNTIVQTFNNVMLGLNGTAPISLSAELSGNYFITIKHRNSIETVSALPVSFEGNTITYSFHIPQLAFGGNLSQMPDGTWVVYGGDVDQDGIVDTGDMTPIDNDASNYTSGYTSTDVNGDGIVDTGDMTIADNNASAYVSAITP
ncbi:MAG: hypothetical protein AB9834_07945 [Lentimicrobium sp.]